MKKINDFINEKLKVTKNSASDTLKVPATIYNADKVYLNKLYKIIQKKVLDEKIDEDGDLSSLVNFYKEYTKNDKKYQTPEMIWGYIYSVLGHILYFDGDILRDNIEHDEVDPVVSTELDLTWGEAYMNIVTYYITNDIFTTPGVVIQ